MQGYGEALSPEMNERLRMEVGWTDVGRGLGQILVGYLIGFTGFVVGFGLVAWAVYGLPDDNGTFKPRTPSVSHLWQLYFGLAILVLVTLYAYAYVAGGLFRCMMGSSERHGARWFMFAALVCMFMGPAFHVAAGIVGIQRGPDFNRASTALNEIKLNQTGQNLQLIGFAIGLAYPLCFLLYLRAAASCLQARIHVLLLNLFLLFAFPLVALTGYSIYDDTFATKNAQVAALLNLGWMGLSLGYLAIIFIMRLCILKTMERVRSPLDY
jgi:hypothetical protein